MHNKFALFVCTLLTSITTLAGSFQISPTQVDLSADQPIATLSLLNQDASSAQVQARLMQWTQKGGEDIYQKTNELILTPPIMSIAPSQNQMIRVAMRHPMASEQELAYRLYLKEFPTFHSSKHAGVHIISQISLPVFIAPTVPVREKLRWIADVTRDKHVQLRLINEGNVHTKVSHLKVNQPTANMVLLDQTTFAYVLPGQFKQWTFPQGAYPVVHVVAMMEKGEQSWDVPVRAASR